MDFIKLIYKEWILLFLAIFISFYLEENIPTKDSLMWAFNLSGIIVESFAVQSLFGDLKNSNFHVDSNNRKKIIFTLLFLLILNLLFTLITPRKFYPYLFVPITGYLIILLIIYILRTWFKKVFK